MIIQMKITSVSWDPVSDLQDDEFEGEKIRSFS